MRAIAVKAAATWSGNAADRVVLDYDDRHRRRMALTATSGLAFLLDLPAATSLRDGDALVLEDGRLVEVVAAPEPLLEIRCADPLHLARLAWHLGNRHVPVQVLGPIAAHPARSRACRDGCAARRARRRDRSAVRSGRRRLCGACRRSSSRPRSSPSRRARSWPVRSASRERTRRVWRRKADAVTGRAVPADDLAVAGLSGRRVLLFGRHRMGGGGRRHRRRGHAAALARGDARATAPD